MKIGYIGSAYTTLNCRPDKSFRLASYSKKRLYDTVDNNLNCIMKTLQFNLQNDLKFYRIADFIPFKTHETSVPLNEILDKFQEKFSNLGRFIREAGFRISMHPGQYTVLNSSKPDVVKQAISELESNVAILDSMNLDSSAKVQIHVGGVYKNKKTSLKRFIQTYNSLSDQIKNRLVVENDDVSFNLADCVEIYEETRIPIILDIFHHSIKNNGESILEALNIVQKTWKNKDGILMVDWSTQEPESRIGRHATTIDLDLFQKFILHTKQYDFDLMLEIKDKERSALQAIKVVKDLERLMSS